MGFYLYTCSWLAQEPLPTVDRFLKRGLYVRVCYAKQELDWDSEDQI
jgi:hypothetical protein